MRLRRPSVPDPLSFRCSVGRAEPQVLFWAAHPDFCRISCIMAVLCYQKALLDSPLCKAVGPKNLPSLVALVITIRTLSPLASSAFASSLISLRVQEHRLAIECRLWSSTTFTSVPLSSQFVVLVAAEPGSTTNSSSTHFHRITANKSFSNVS